MSAMDYSGPERRRGGPDRRNVGEVTRILIVDDHALFRVGIANILGREREALHGAVVERDVRLLPSLVGADGEAVVLACDEDAAGGAVDDGMVRAAVAERQLVGLPAGRES